MSYICVCLPSRFNFKLAMKKSKDHIKRFLSTFRPAGEKDELLIMQFLGKRKFKSPVFSNPSLDTSNSESVTIEQFKAWYNADMPITGDIIRCEKTGDICLVTRGGWNSYVIGAILTPENALILRERTYTDEKRTQASDEEINALQKALAAAGYDWNPNSLSLVNRDIPQSPKYVRLMVMGGMVGIGIFKRILPDNTLEMVCVKMRNEPIRCSDDLTLGDADYFSFFDTYEEHRAIIQQELAKNNLIWNAHCRSIQNNYARAKAGENYFWVSSYLEIKQATENGSISDRRRFNRGNYFLKRAVALRARDRIINVCKEEMMAGDNI